MNYMPPVLGAFVFVGISAAIMSTMDSLINTGAMTLTLDLFPQLGDETKMLSRSHIATLLVTAVALTIALGIRSILQISWIASDIITTGVFVPLVAGFVWRRGNSKGAMASMTVGLLYSFSHLPAQFGVALPFPWKIGSATQVLVGIGLSFVVYVVVSLFTPPEYEKADGFIQTARGKKK